MRTIKFRAWVKGEMFGNRASKRWLSIGRTFPIYMQYTGLKDKNGKELYESDYVEDKHGFIKEIIWSHCGWRLKDGDVSYPLEDYISDVPTSAELIITGNKYEIE